MAELKLAQVQASEAAMRTEGEGEVKLKIGVTRKRRRAHGCGSCPGCLKQDCGQCCNCRDKVKFGGPGTKKQRCMFRACTNMVSMRRTCLCV